MLHICQESLNRKPWQLCRLVCLDFRGSKVLWTLGLENRALEGLGFRGLMDVGYGTQRTLGF